MPFSYDDYDPYQFDNYYSHRPLATSRPWSPPPTMPQDGDDGGAIARYLANQETKELGRNSQRRLPEEFSHSWKDYPAQDYNYDYSQPSSSNRQFDGNRPPKDYSRPRNRERRQEASEISIEALDLADYTATLRSRPGGSSRPHNDHYEMYQPNYPMYHKSSQHHSSNTPHEPDYDDYRLHSSIERPYSAASFSTSIPPPPSLVSGPSTLHSSSHLSSEAYFPKPNARHLSLPPLLGPAYNVTTAADPAIFSENLPNQSWRTKPKDGNRAFDTDVRKFPKWSRGWYDAATGKRSLAPPPQFESDIATWPAMEQQHDYYGGEPHSNDDRYNSLVAPPVPWHDVGREGSPAPPYVSDAEKEERMKMLEREFGQTKIGKKDPTTTDRNIGTIQPDGTLVTPGPRRRTTLRVLQGLLSFAAAFAGIYAAIMIRPAEAAPPSGKPAAYILYLLSVLSLLLVIYLFTIRPCLRKRRRQKNDKYTGGGAGHPGSMMILPIVQQLGGTGKKSKKTRKKGKGKKGQNEGDGVQVNLIVDPSMFGGTGSGKSRGRRGDGTDSEDDQDDNDSWTAVGSSKTRKSNTSKRSGASKGRPSIFQAIAMENDWKAARKAIKWNLAIDILFTLLWGAEFFFILWGEKCPIGKFQGWCDAYNSASACACMLCAAFGISISFDIRDLVTSKVNPRSRV